MAIEEYHEKTTVVETGPQGRVTDDLVMKRRSFAFIYYILNIIEVLLLIRLVLRLLAANPTAGFTQLVYNITTPLIAPFAGIFPTPAAGGSVLECSTLVAMIVYALIAYAIVRLLQIMTSRRP